MSRSLSAVLLIAVLACERPVAAPPPVVPPAPATTGTQDPTPTPGPGDPQEGPIDEHVLAVPPVQEPDWPLTRSAEELEKLGWSSLAKGGYQFTRKLDGGETVSGAVVPAMVILNRGLIELFGCIEGGKEHESILRLECDVQQLDLALRLSGFRRGPVPETLGADAPQGTRAVVLVQWTEDGKSITHRVEDLVISVKRRGTMPRVGWTYVALLVETEDHTAPGRKGPKVLAATGSRSLLTTWRDRSSLLDNPLPDAVDDTAFAANHVLLPAQASTVAVIIRTPTKAEREEIARLEKELAK